MYFFVLLGCLVANKALVFMIQRRRKRQFDVHLAEGGNHTRPIGVQNHHLVVPVLGFRRTAQGGRNSRRFTAGLRFGYNLIIIK